MAINSCSINEHTINSLCGNRRSAIISILLGGTPPAEVVGGGQQQHVRNDTRLPINMRRREVEREDNELQPHYYETIVTVELNGESYSCALEHDDDLIPMVSVSKLTHRIVDDSDSIQVNISELAIKVK